MGSSESTPQTVPEAVARMEPGAYQTFRAAVDDLAQPWRRFVAVCVVLIIVGVVGSTSIVLLLMHTTNFRLAAFQERLKSVEAKIDEEVARLESRLVVKPAEVLEEVRKLREDLKTTHPLD